MTETNPRANAFTAPILSHSVLWLAIGQLGFALGALGLWILSRHYRRRLAGRLPP